MSQQNKTRAGLLAGNIQCSQVIGEAWDGMTETARDEITRRWEEILDHSAKIVDDVVASISTHERLGPAWQELSEEMRTTRTDIFQCILLNQLTHPDGTVSIQRETKPDGEQDGGGQAATHSEST